jgi:hypothetical protein
VGQRDGLVRLGRAVDEADQLLPGPLVLSIGRLLELNEQGLIPGVLALEETVNLDLVEDIDPVLADGSICQVDQATVKVRACLSGGAVQADWPDCKSLTSSQFQRYSPIPLAPTRLACEPGEIFSGPVRPVHFHVS